MPRLKRVPPLALEVFRWVVAFHDRRGYMPSLREIATGMGMKSHTGARYYLEILEDAGYLVRRINAARAYQVTEAGERARV